MSFHDQSTREADIASGIFFQYLPHIQVACYLGRAAALQVHQGHRLQRGEVPQIQGGLGAISEGTRW